MAKENNGWTVQTLKEYLDALLSEREKANDQRFKSQEEAIKTAEHSRDVAINKAEVSIEKKADAVYVKFTGLQDTLTKVMLRSEIESRFKGVMEKIEDLKDFKSTTTGKSLGSTGLVLMTGTIVSIVGGIIAIVYAFSK